MIAVIDYEMGNVGSVLNMMKKLGITAKLTRDPLELERASGIILPGVGTFDRGIQQLRKHDLVNALNDLVLGKGKHCLGICLGMQLMAQGSEEGALPGMGWIESTVRKFSRDPDHPQLRIPHMGWNIVTPTTYRNPLFKKIQEPLRYYFVHSYHYPADLSCAIGITNHIVPFASALAKNNIYGCQFHPEKSHSFGLGLLSNFARLATQAQDL
jgi:glutamine amidotransferase